MAAILLAPAAAGAGACGGGVFAVAAGAGRPTRTGGRAYAEFDDLDQDRKRSGTARAPAAENPDRELWSAFTIAGVQSLFDRSWGLEAALPEGSFRLHDRGSAAAGEHTGYARALLAPGLEVRRGGPRVFAGVGFPVYDGVRGNRLAAREYDPCQVSREF